MTERITTSLSPAHHRKKKNSAQISPYTKLTQTTAPILGGQKPKGKKNSTLKLVKGHLKHNKLKKKKRKGSEIQIGRAHV